ncbi:hypothetical protein N9R61_01490, partial [Flavobacteriaceae bacterium]|nr:hypothetical protein [Flavobacteriaceae bacterium]
NANEEINNFTNALPVAIEKIEILKRKLAINLPKDELEIFESYYAMVNDPEVIEKTISLIDNYNYNADFALTYSKYEIAPYLAYTKISDANHNFNLKSNLQLYLKSNQVYELLDLHLHLKSFYL